MESARAPLITGASCSGGRRRRGTIFHTHVSIDRCPCCASPTRISPSVLIISQNPSLRRLCLKKSSGRRTSEILASSSSNVDPAQPQTSILDALVGPSGKKLDIALSEPAASYSAASADEHSSKSQDDQNVAKRASRSYNNKFIRWVKLGALINDAALSFFKSEVRRRTFITISLLMVCRAGQYIPLPGFDHRIAPSEFVMDPATEATLPWMSFFTLGLGPYVCASTIVHFCCTFYPPFKRMKKEAEVEKLQSHTWWLTFYCSILQSLLFSIATLQYSTATNALKHVLVTSFYLTCGAMLLHRISQVITKAGFGQGSTLIICMGILLSSSRSLCTLLSTLSRSTLSTWGPALLVYAGVFLGLTAAAVLVTEGRRIVKLEFYGFDRFPSTSGDGVSEVQPYIPFDITPAGMLPVYMASCILAVPGFLAKFFQRPFLLRLHTLLNPSADAKSWLYHILLAVFIFLFSAVDVSDGAKDISEYINRIGARITDVKPGRSTVEFLRKVQDSARYWGGILLALLVTVSTLLDCKLRSVLQMGVINFTSLLILVGTIIEVRRSVMAYQAMHTLSKVLKRYGV